MSAVLRPDLTSHLTSLRFGIAFVWILFGLLFKALGALPRHRRIVERVVGQRASGVVLFGVAAGETLLGSWMIYGRWLPVCVGIQTAAIIVMNGLELRYAKDLLLSPVVMVCANVVLLSAGWYVALAT
jgi:hypothetical protein